MFKSTYEIFATSGIDIEEFAIIQKSLFVLFCRKPFLVFLDRYVEKRIDLNSDHE